MSTPPNMQRFNTIAARLLADLYDVFPEPIDVEYDKFGAAVTPLDAGPGELVAYQSLVGSAVSWLAAEGFIRQREENRVYGGALDLQLTMRGLTVLGYIPASVQDAPKQEALVDRLKSALSSAGKDAAGEVIKTLVGKAFEIALRMPPNIPPLSA